MITAHYPTSVTADAVDKSSPSFANPAVAHCCKAWKKAFRASINADEDDYDAFLKAAETYRAAMPPLSTHDGCLDFIACVAHGILLGAISEKDSGKLLYAAQVALAASNNVQNSRKSSPSRANPTITLAKRIQKFEDIGAQKL
jgi:hypothetical protein